MTEAEFEKLYTMLLIRGAEYAGAPPQNLIDEDRDVYLADSPFGIWGRVGPGGRPDLPIVLLSTPLMEAPAGPEVEATIRAAIGNDEVVVRRGGASVQLFTEHPVRVLRDTASFRAAVEGVLATGRRVVTAVQAAHGGLTTEQSRVLRGWRGVDEAVEALLASTAGEGTVLAHGWNPRRESPPLLCFEDRVDRAWANRFVTVETDGAVRLRSTVPGTREGARGYALTVHRMAPEAAVAWAGRLGVTVQGGKVEAGDVTSLAGRPWSELWAAMEGLELEEGSGWQAVG